MSRPNEAAAAEPKHTRGRWEYSPEDSGIVSSERLIAETCCPNPRAAAWENQEEEDANGYLLAAAPQLLEALRKVIEPDAVLGEYAARTCYCDIPEDPEDGIIVCAECRAREEVALVRAALAAAEGQQPESAEGGEASND